MASGDLVALAPEFAVFGPGPWIGALGSILGQFVRASRGDVKASFWRSLDKFNHASGGPAVTGRITAFFPYLKERRTGLATVRVGHSFGEGQISPGGMSNPGEGPSRFFAHSPKIESLPVGLSKAPFRWEYLDPNFEMEFLGGFVGVSQDRETSAPRPEIGWAIREGPGPP